jgi:hypothetical protein
MSDQILPDADRPQNARPKRIRQQPITLPGDTKPIPGHPGYRADARGQAYSCWRGKGGRGNRTTVQTDSWYVLRPTRIKGHLRVQIRDEAGNIIFVYLHRLILITFVGPPPFPGADARHLNGVRADNRAENLAWGTRADNVADAAGHGTIAKKLTADAVREIRRLRAEGDTAKSIADRYGISDTQVFYICSRKQWKHVT